MADDQHSEVHGDPAQQYTLLIEDTARITDRRHNTNTLYLSANSILLGGSALLAQQSGLKDALSLVLVWLIAGAGFVLCHDWRLIILGYQRMIRLRFGMLEKLELDPHVGPIRVFHEQRENMEKILGSHAPGGFSGIEAKVPRVFQVTYMLITLAAAVAAFAANSTAILSFLGRWGILPR